MERGEVEEHVERVPWSVLDRSERVARWSWYLGGAVLLAAVLSAGLVYAMRSNAPASVLPVSVAPPMTQAAVTTPPPPEAAPVVASPAPAPTAYSEADLLALVDDENQQLLLAVAETHVHQYFSRNDATGVSHIEWARAVRVDRHTSGSYEVLVAFSAVVGPPEGPFIRSPLRTVSLSVETAGGAAQVIGLPQPITTANFMAPEPIGELVAIDELPTEAILLAQADAAPWGPVEVLGGWYDESWTVVVAVTDAGGRWELAVPTDVR